MGLKCTVVIYEYTNILLCLGKIITTCNFFLADLFFVYHIFHLCYPHPHHLLTGTRLTGILLTLSFTGWREQKWIRERDVPWRERCSMELEMFHGMRGRYDSPSCSLRLPTSCNVLLYISSTDSSPPSAPYTQTELLHFMQYLNNSYHLS